jgi:hypothetical protein
MSKTIDFEFNMKSFHIANKIWQKYFSIPQSLEELIPKFDYSTTLGVHFRGTDKNFSGEANFISQDEFIIIIKDYLKNNKIQNIYCCSDEEKFIKKMRAEFHNVNIIDYDQKRSSNDSLALHKNIQQDDKKEHTRAAIIDMIALSRCHTILKTSSAMSSFSKIVNPNINLITCCAMKQRWFPTGVVEVYKSTDVAVNNILMRTMQSHVYW